MFTDIRWQTTRAGVDTEVCPYKIGNVRVSCRGGPPWPPIGIKLRRAPVTSGRSEGRMVVLNSRPEPRSVP